MTAPVLPRYPVYIVSKGRSDTAMTAKLLLKDGVPFHIVVEPQEHDAYAAVVGAEHVLTLPFSNLGRGSIPARNWIWEHARATRAQRHWILDDNIRDTMRRFRAIKIPCHAGVALAAIEDFCDRYENIGIAGMNYDYFALNRRKIAPFFRNCHVYSSLLIRNNLPYRWRGRYNEDTDLCLQLLAGGLCTVLFNAFMIQKVPTLTMKGGNATELYQGDGRLKMARALERMWPGVVTTKRRFNRPQHVVKDSWRKFDTPLVLRADVVLDTLASHEYGLQLVEKKPIASKAFKALLRDRLVNVETRSAKARRKSAPRVTTPARSGKRKS
jgi:hypothetical protein